MPRKEVKAKWTSNPKKPYSAGFKLFSLPGLKHRNNALESKNPSKCTSPSNFQCLTFAATSLPKIPKLSADYERFIEGLKDHKAGQDSSTYIRQHLRRKRGPSRKRTKLNGFMAYRSFFSRNVATDQQGVLSSQLAKEWERNPEIQLVWKRYSTEYNLSVLSDRLPFFDWLLLVTSEPTCISENIYDNKDPGTFSRIQDVFNTNEADENHQFLKMSFDVSVIDPRIGQAFEHSI